MRKPFAGLIAITVASLVLLSCIVPVTMAIGLETIIGAVTITAVAYTSYQIISLYKISSVAPQASGPFLCDILGAIGMPCKPNVPTVLDIRRGQESTMDRIKKAIENKDPGKLIDLLKSLISRGYDIVTIGADARPTANGQKFTYRTYTRWWWDNKVYVSRWDFYPPGSWTINNWYIDLNGDGQADIVLPSNVYGFYVA